jgi:hypothetical protein
MSIDGGQAGLNIKLEHRTLSVAPGGSLTFPVLLHNSGTKDDFAELVIRGIPSNWVSMPAPVIRLSAGEQREISLSLQVPDEPHGGTGRHSMIIRAVSQEDPARSAEVEATLTIAALEVQGRIGLLMASTEFSVAPGSSVSVPITLINQGLEADTFQLSVEGIPASWVSTTSSLTYLSPGSQRDIELTIQPPRAAQSGAGRTPFALRVLSQMAPGQQAEAQCTLTLAVFSQFRGELRPARIEARQPAHVTVENQGNVQQSFNLTWQSPEGAILVEPTASQELRVPAGEMAMAEYQAQARRRPILGSDTIVPFSVRIQAAEGQIQNLRGELISKPQLPNWVVPVVLVAIMAFACLFALSVLLIDSGDDVPVQPPAATATSEPDVPAPTQEPPPVEVTQPPPVEPTQPPPVEPTEPPPVEVTQPPPVEPTEGPPGEPTEEPPDGVQLPELPCAPAALSLAVVPLIVLRRKQI